MSCLCCRWRLGSASITLTLRTLPDQSDSCKVCCAAKARRGKQEVDVDSLKGEELDMALADAILQFQERNTAALKQR